MNKTSTQTKIRLQKRFLYRKAFLNCLATIGILLFSNWLSLAAPGELDQAFGNNGKVLTQIGNFSSADTLAIQPDGKIVVGGGYLVRYNPNGSLDTTFDSDGYVLLDFDARKLLIQSDGKFLVAGTIFGATNADFAVARYNIDGSPDTTFDGDGKVITSVGSGDDIIYGMTLQTDGKIVVTGESTTGTNRDFAVVRYNTNGSLDTSFDSDGKVTTPIGTNTSDISYSIDMQPDGKIVAAGRYLFNGFYDIALVRYNSDGSLDNTFDSDGKVTTSIGGDDVAYSIVIQSNGKITVAGYSFISGTNNDFALVRYNADGSLDTSFDSDGKVTTPISNSNYERSYAMFIQPNGKIVAAGETQDGSGSGFALVKYNSNGSLDTSFGSNGKVTTFFGTISDGARAIVGQSDGKIIAGGFSNSPNGQFIALARYLNDSTPNKLFDYDGDGKTDVSIFRPANGQWWINRSSTEQAFAAQFGEASDKITPGDFTGDGKTDIAFWRPSTGQWYVLRSEDASFYAFPFGASGDIPAPGDFDGDGRTDAAVFRPSNSAWYILRSSGGTVIQSFGTVGDAPIVADYDGDGKTDIAITRINGTNREWWIRKSSDGQVFAATFGEANDKASPGDYTGDGKSDVAFFRPSSGTWYILRSEDFSFYGFPFGSSGDIPASGDFDGDGKFDPAVFRPSNGSWYVQQSAGGVLIRQFGVNGDRPTPSAYIP